MMRSAVLAMLLFGAGSVFAHHSYAMFDGSRTLDVTGTVAKFEWMNPHVFIWIYVANPQAEGGYDLYAFENGSPNVLARLGWTRTSLTAGEQIVVQYWPLKDGRNGGHYLKAVLKDGRVLYGAGGPNVRVEGEPHLSTGSPPASDRPSP